MTFIELEKNMFFVNRSKKSKYAWQAKKIDIHV